MQTMTIIVPCYNEEEALPYFYEEISKIRQQLTEISLKLLFINDGSTDNTLAILKKLASSDNSVEYISFSRNFGKEAAMYAGLKNSTSARDFRLMNRPFVDALLELNEYNRFSKGLFGWVGFRTKWIEFENTERIAGETKWSFFQLVRYSLDGMISFSTAPLKLASFTGMFMCIISFLAIIFIIVRQLLFGGSAFGWPSMACIVIFIGGIQLLCIGILGSYLSRTYMEVKKRPIYVCQESNLSPDKAVKSE